MYTLNAPRVGREGFVSDLTFLVDFHNGGQIAATVTIVGS